MSFYKKTIYMIAKYRDMYKFIVQYNFFKNDN